jgi:acyl-coenzyme A synthetase/AMP-(fatty) acid ligase
VVEAYVVGAPDEDTGEAIHSFVVPVAGRTPDDDALRELVVATPRRRGRPEDRDHD